MKCDYVSLTLKISRDFSIPHCDSLPVCVHLFLREIQVPREFWAAKEKRAPRALQGLQEYQDPMASEGKLEVQESQVWGAFGGLVSW